MTVEHILAIKYFTTENANSIYWLADIKVELYKFENLSKISKTSISKFFKWATNKLSRRNKNNNVTSMKHQSSRALWIASWIRDAGFTIVYLDEFRYSAHEDKFYGWWRKASNSVYWANPQTFNMSFWVMMS